MLPTTTDVTPARRQRCRQLSTARRQEFAFRVRDGFGIVFIYHKIAVLWHCVEDTC